MTDPLMYTLAPDGETPVPVYDYALVTGNLWQDKRRIVDQTTVGPYLVSTVFLNVDHGFGLTQLPLLWETMIFGNESLTERYCERYTSRLLAVVGHERAVAIAKGWRVPMVEWRVGKARVSARMVRGRWKIHQG